MTRRFPLDSGHTKLERSYDRWEKYLDQLVARLADDETAHARLLLGSEMECIQASSALS